MNFKTLVTVCLATLTLAQLSTPAQANPSRNDNYSSPAQTNSVRPLKSTLAQSNSVRTRKSATGVKEVVLFSQGMNRGKSFGSNEGVADLSKVGFDNKAVAIQVNNSQKWRFYTGKNFSGQFVEIGPEEGRGFLGKFNRKISSFKSVK
jgi:hypothetical protein